ncbi:hypothetical protein [Streptomyces sp. YU58]|uniref:hypothetical protein n=1 Tax=Streptomyces sp. SX92 TaxID=3158972 RepID=UPI0027B962A0|nr:hypothetical protein [Streptomyces coralus]WLW51597.1 hypothetical protein QU709_09560 [Streptomyces coralus]
MGDSLGWLGEHCYEPRGKTPGMRGGVSLTAVRGLAVQDLLRRLRARDEDTAAPRPYRDLVRTAAVRDLTPCMYGTAGEWSFVLEDHGSATWYEWWFDDDPEVRPRPGEEMVCLNANIAVQPCRLVYAPGDGPVRFTDFRDSPLDSSPLTDPTAKVTLLDRALREAGAVWPDSRDFSHADDWRRFVDENAARLPAAVWRAVGECLGIRLPRTEVERGDLPAALLRSPFA